MRTMLALVRRHGPAKQDRHHRTEHVGNRSARVNQRIENPLAEKRRSTTSSASRIKAWKKLLSAFVWKSGRHVYSTSPATTPRPHAVFRPHQ